MEEILNLGQANLFDVTLDVMIARVIQKVNKTLRDDPHQTSDTKNEQSEEQDDGKMGLHVAYAPALPSNN